MKIPQYQAQVAPAAQGPQYSSGLKLADTIGPALQNLQQGLTQFSQGLLNVQQVATGIEKYKESVQKEADDTWVKLQLAELSRFAANRAGDDPRTGELEWGGLSVPAQGFGALQGDNAISNLELYQNHVRKFAESMEAKLRNQRQKEQFRIGSTSIIGRAEEAMATHAHRQTQIVNEAAIVAIKQASFDEAMTYYDNPKTIENITRDAQDEAAIVADIKGRSEEEMKQDIKEREHIITLGVIEGFVQHKRYTEALDYLEKNHDKLLAGKTDAGETFAIHLENKIRKMRDDVLKDRIADLQGILMGQIETKGTFDRAGADAKELEELSSVEYAKILKADRLMQKFLKTQRKSQPMPQELEIERGNILNWIRKGNLIDPRYHETKTPIQMTTEEVLKTIRPNVLMDAKYRNKVIAAHQRRLAEKPQEYDVEELTRQAMIESGFAPKTNEKRGVDAKAPSTWTEPFRSQYYQAIHELRTVEEQWIADKANNPNGMPLTKKDVIKWLSTFALPGKVDDEKMPLLKAMREGRLEQFEPTLSTEQLESIKKEIERRGGAIMFDEGKYNIRLHWRKAVGLEPGKIVYKPPGITERLKRRIFEPSAPPKPSPTLKAPLKNPGGAR